MDPQVLATAAREVQRAAGLRLPSHGLGPASALAGRLVAAAVNLGGESSGCAATATTTTTSNMSWVQKAAKQEPLTLALLCQLPASALEVIHCLAEHMYRVFFANDLENNITYSACCFDGTAQPSEIDHSRANWIMTPGLQTCVRNMHECDMFVMREQARYGILLDVGGVRDVVDDFQRIIVGRLDDTGQLPDGRSEAVRSILEEESLPSLFGQWNQIAQTLVQPSIRLVDWR